MTTGGTMASATAAFCEITPSRDNTLAAVIDNAVVPVVWPLG
jgi:hypothetical protein